MNHKVSRLFCHKTSFFEHYALLSTAHYNEVGYGNSRVLHRFIQINFILSMVTNAGKSTGFAPLASDNEDDRLDCYTYGIFYQNYRRVLENLHMPRYDSYMKEYLSHFSAAVIWDIPFVETVLGSDIVLGSTDDVTVSKHGERPRPRGRTIHSCERKLPTGAVVTRNGKMVASPELLFIQLASILSAQRLILLGLQLCSHPPGCPAKAITTKQKLKAFLAKTPGHRGHVKATQAVKYIENGAASVMESLAYMMLTLPHALGGYGLDGAVFNHEIKLKAESGKRLGQNRCFADLYYKRAKLAVEYESFAFHSSPSEQGKDILRSAVLDRQGVEVLRLSTIQLYDMDACMDFAFNLASRLGKRLQIRAKRFNEMHALLRSLLPAGKPVEPTQGG